MKKLLYFFTLALLFSCSGKAPVESAPDAVDNSGYELYDIPGSDVQKAIKKNSQGQIVEQGFMKNGYQEGTWTIYPEGIEFPEKLISYTNGFYNGLYLEFNQRGQIKVMANYKNNKLDGSWGVYRFGRAEKTAYYLDGELHGAYKEFKINDGKIIKEINYKNGKMHGPYRFYNDDGDVTLEYEYKNGEKVSGGIVEPSNANAPK